jgi:SnoaL-like domain
MCRRILQTAFACLVASPWLVAQAPADARKGRPMTLTAADYIEIQQLVVRYSYALDTGAANGEMFASLFARDGVFVSATRGPITGHDQLLALGKGRDPMYPRRFIVNHVVEPSGEGATGKVYVVEVDLPSEGEKLGGQLTSTGGRYEDVYEKTVTGWKFKRRAFVPSKMAVPGAAARQASSQQQ